MTKVILLSWFLILIIDLTAQNYDISEEIAEQLSDQISQSEDNPIDQQILERLPILNVNKATFEELKHIPWLTSFQIHNLLDHIKNNGQLLSLYELQAVPGWDLGTIRLTVPLLKIPTNVAFRDNRKIREQLAYDGGIEISLRSRRRLEPAAGYRPDAITKFNGGPTYWLGSIRYRRKGALDIGLRIEKDAGEPFRWKPKQAWYGSDHTSVFVQLENKGLFKKIIVGDFGVHWDQGLILGRGLSFRKQVITGPRKVHSGINPHTSTREFGFYRGVGMECQIGSFILGALISRRLLDANVQEADSTLTMPRRITSLIETGLRRTTTEIEKRKSVKSIVGGLHLQKLWGRNIITSLSALYHKLNIPIIPIPRRYNEEEFKGSKNLNLSAGLEVLWENVNLYSQFAYSHSGGWSGLAGLTTSLSSSFSMTLHIRNYGQNYHAISGGAFGVRSNNRNERGIYWAFQYSPHKRWTSGFYSNIYKIPGPSFGTDSGFSGIDQLLRIQFIPNKAASIDTYWRGTRKPTNQKEPGKATHQLTNTTKNNFGLRGTWQNTNFEVQCRIQLSAYKLNKTNTYGKILGSQVSYDVDLFKITTNLTLFDTDDFENRQYIYERDLPYGLSIPFFHGIGVRWFVLLKLRAFRNLGFWVKFAQTEYRDRENLGSGPDLIVGSKRSDLSFQLRFKL